MAVRDRKATEKGREYQLNLKYKAVEEALRNLKYVSEEPKSFIVKKLSVTEAKLLYTGWMDFCESFIQADNTYCSLLSEDNRKQHRETWFQDRNV